MITYSLELRDTSSTIITNILAIGYLITRVVMMGNLNIDPDLRPAVAFSATTVVLALAFAAALVGAIMVRKIRPLVFFGVVWFFLHLMPTNSVIPRLDVASEHHLYLPLLGLLLILAPPLAVDGAMRKICFVIILCVMFIFTIKRNAVYATEITLWEDAAAKSPAKARPHNNLGYAYYLSGRLDEAEKEYRAALACDPAFYKARNNLLFLREKFGSGLPVRNRSGPAK